MILVQSAFKKRPREASTSGAMDDNLHGGVDMTQPTPVCQPPLVRGPNKGNTATGTRAGYNRHRNAGEPACDECLTAVREDSREWDRANKKRLRDQNREKYRQWDRAYYQRNRARRLKANAEYRERNWPKVSAKIRERYERDRDQKLAYNRAYYLANQERLKAAQRAWNAANKEHTKEARRRYRVRRLNAPGSHTKEEWLLLLALYDGVCAYCSNAAETRDHIVPLSRGGSDDIDNIAPACLSCNSSKSARFLWEWREVSL